MSSGTWPINGVVTLHLRDARVLVRLEVLVELLVVADEDEAVARDEDRFRVILEVVDQVRTTGSRPVVLCGSNLTPSSRSFDFSPSQGAQFFSARRASFAKVTNRAPVAST